MVPFLLGAIVARRRCVVETTRRRGAATTGTGRDVCVFVMVRVVLIVLGFVS